MWKSIVANLDLRVRLARNWRDVASAQALRYRVFYKEMGAAAGFRTKLWRRDIDCFDRACNHLLVIDRAPQGAAGDLLPGGRHLPAAAQPGRRSLRRLLFGRRVRPAADARALRQLPRARPLVR